MIARPVPLSEPPPDFAERGLPIREFAARPWYRGHKVTRDPIHFNRANGRFAAPDGESFGTLYLDADPNCSFIEMFALAIQPAARVAILTEHFVRQSCICEVTTTRPLRVVDLTTGSALRRLSPRADNRISDGDHVVSQRWASAIWAHPSRPDGIYYRSRNAPDRFAVALFDRTEPILIARGSPNLLQDAHLLGSLLDEFDCALI